MKLRIRRSVFAGLIPIYVADVFLSLHYNSLIYVNSSFLEKFYSADVVGFIFILGSVMNIALLLLLVRLEKRFGNRGFYFIFLTIEALAVLGLALVSNSVLLALLFILFQGTSAMIFYSLDVFLEDASPKKETGKIRGVYLTLLNLAVVLSPAMIAIFAPEGEFLRLYIISALFLIPLFFLGIFSFKGFRDGHERWKSLPVLAWWRHKSIRRASLVRMALNIFYSFMVIYMPIYLRQNIGFSWTEISIIFTIMLLPFVMFQIPVGRLADKLYGEKEFMTLGLFIVGTTLLVLPFIKEADLVIWAGLLFLSRVGASFVEISTESYFFKQVNKHDLGMIGLFRMTWPIAFILAPLCVILVLKILPFETTFILLALLMLQSMNASTKIQDTL